MKKKYCHIVAHSAMSLDIRSRRQKKRRENTSKTIWRSTKHLKVEGRRKFIICYEYFLACVCVFCGFLFYLKFILTRHIMKYSQTFHRSHKLFFFASSSLSLTRCTVECYEIAEKEKHTKKKNKKKNITRTCLLLLLFPLWFTHFRDNFIHFSYFFCFSFFHSQKHVPQQYFHHDMLVFHLPHRNL